MAQQLPLSSASSEADLHFHQAALLALLYVRGLSCRDVNKLLKHVPLARMVTEPECLQCYGVKADIIGALSALNMANYERKIQAFKHQGIDVIALGTSAYPELLTELPDAPLLLFCRGNTQLLKRPQIAMVGSRSASLAGKRCAQEIAQQLSAAGLIITSGMAMGVDAMSHQGALMATGQTVAVLGTGVYICYPRRNKALRDDILAKGLLVSEFVPTTPARAMHFPRRNRIIAGLSVATLVVEAERKSGSLITAELAADYNREVMAIPGSINNPYAKGCHKLIKEGAALVESAKDVLQELGFSAQNGLYIKSEPTYREDENSILRHIGYEPTCVDDIASSAEVPITELLTQLVDLELEGLIESTSEGYVKTGGG
ncbi:DNA-processing protein DprA [Pseudoalteromonas ruthenica]|uniref:DNA-processing protein DprA n=1 Tax=Pseudoalteromonas ruthenica TaxID=151081 RepID=UPI000345ED26|nr:DNA-processing protein DprA [Pseudoalteromonas ruthenica]